jgi:excisionase family DNA binding protein
MPTRDGLIRNPISITEAATRRGVARQTVLQWVRKGWLPAQRVGSQWIVDADTVANFKPPKPGPKTSVA